jgi:hypothetical protein
MPTTDTYRKTYILLNDKIFDSVLRRAKKKEFLERYWVYTPGLLEHRFYRHSKSNSRVITYNSLERYGDYCETGNFIRTTKKMVKKDLYNDNKCQKNVIGSDKVLKVTLNDIHYSERVYPDGFSAIICYKEFVSDYSYKRWIIDYDSEDVFLIDPSKQSDVRYRSLNLAMEHYIPQHNAEEYKITVKAKN